MNVDIGEVVARSGVPASTLRYYEERHLIRSTGRRGQRRQFAPEVLPQLALIAVGRTAGFSLDEIARMFTADGHPAIDRTQLTAKADDLDHTIARLTTISDALRHAAACPAPSHMQCPTFRTLLAQASGIALTW
ncbi:MerR family transcriptional regulator [Nocardia sp. SYP-A9097]|uniref:helix-turn-helix domain-containing protein n=1 Tax=Nocardia sp. SYP-A9097 TaxID=2663237 RepID=UPI00129B57EE|nr:helix-turn-helix domain-containing protein [Nocardia sp. SYP-A9097]MRH90172.1 MerR family transcriptional regulator [Nocardia sp. SYP-A9097]